MPARPGTSGALAGEVGAVLVDGDVRKRVAVLKTGGGDGVDASEDPVPDGMPVGPLEGGVYTQGGRPAS